VLGAESRRGGAGFCPRLRCGAGPDCDTGQAAAGMTPAKKIRCD
jgi:hypothetical protein